MENAQKQFKEDLKREMLKRRLRLSYEKKQNIKMVTKVLERAYDKLSDEHKRMIEDA